MVLSTVQGPAQPLQRHVLNLPASKAAEAEAGSKPFPWAGNQEGGHGVLGLRRERPQTHKREHT